MTTKKPAAKRTVRLKKDSDLTLGGGSLGNPGYSFAASKWNWWKMSNEPVGIVWVGKAGGDTQANRDLFKAWLKSASIVQDVEKLVWRDKLPEK